LWHVRLSPRKLYPARGLIAFLGVSVVSGGVIIHGSLALAETKFTPSANLSQRYDSNVWYGPKEFIPEGSQAWDLVTTAGGAVQIVDKNRLGDSVLSAGVSGSAFAYNTDLSFVSTNLFAASDLSGWANELLSGLKFRLSDSFQYTPEPPAFLTGGRPSEISDAFSRGLQAVRANTFTNTLLAQGEYSIARSVGLRGDYSFSLFRVGQILTVTPTDAPVAFFNTTLQNVTAGPTYTFDVGDTVFLKFNYVSGDTSGQGVNLRYNSYSIAPEYTSKLLPSLRMTVSAGASLVEQAGNRTFFAGKFELATDFDRPTQLRVSVSRQTTPAFFGTGGALISNVAQLSFTHNFSKVWQLRLNGNYAYNVSAPVDNFTFESIMATGLLEYKLTRTTAISLSQEYDRFSYTGILPFDRLATMLALTTEWK